MTTDCRRPPPAPPLGPISTGNNYKLLGTEHLVKVKDPTGAKEGKIDSTLQVKPLHILLTLPSLWSESQKRKELAKQELEREQEIAARIKKIVQNLEELLEGKLQLKQPVAATAEEAEVPSKKQNLKKFTFADLAAKPAKRNRDTGLEGTVKEKTETISNKHGKIEGITSSDKYKADANALTAKDTLKSRVAKAEMGEKVKLNSGSAPSMGEKTRFKFKRMGLGKAHSPAPIEVK